MLNRYSVSVRNERKPDWDFFQIICENEEQIIEYLDKHYPNRKNSCFFDRNGEPTPEAHDWTEIRFVEKAKFPFIIWKDGW